MRQVIDADLATFMQRSVMIVAATPAGQRAAIARGAGLRLDEAWTTIDLLVSRAQWPEATRGLRAGQPFAVTLSDPTNYRTFQIKARLAEVADADAEDRAMADDYVGRMSKTLRDLGVEPRQAACWLVTEDVVRLRLIPVSVFRQTPGPDAGAAHTPAPQRVA